MVPLHRAASRSRRSKGFKREGIDLARDHHDDFPPEFWYWDEIGRKMTVTEYLADQAIRTEVFDALRSVLDRYDYPGVTDARRASRSTMQPTAIRSVRPKSRARRSTG